MQQAAEVTDAVDAKRYEARFGDELAGFAQYLRRPGLIAFVHTEVDPRHEGRGVGSALVRTSLDEARAAGPKVLPACPFYARWISDQPEYRDLVRVLRSRVTD